jgi:hypothetical protein
MLDSAALAWTEIVEKHRAAMVDELASRLDSEIETAVASAIAAERARAGAETDRIRHEAIHSTREATLRDTAESLNQTLRRLHQTAAQAPALQLLAEASAPWAERAVVISLEDGQQPHSLAFRGIDAGEEGISFPIEEAAAIGSAIESKDPVVALATGVELSPALASAFGDDPELKAYLFPIVVRQAVVAMLVATGVTAPAPLELLCEAAGMKMEALVPEPVRALKPLPGPDLVQISPPELPSGETSPTETAERRTWNDLTADDQRLHLQAQRVARVRVAEMRLYHAEDLQKGLFAGDIYSALRTEIDKARTEFLQTFLSKSDTMVDYLHLEILRSLAHDDDRLLGVEYPGPMV